MSAVGAFTVTKENIEDDRALLTRGVIGTGTEVSYPSQSTSPRREYVFSLDRILLMSVLFLSHQ